ncbi:MAG: S9 family peptidase [Clostridia bacterium]|nr:S9 family peptidase [Clostridia bacterium]
MKKIEINDFLDFKFVSNPGFSPDGKLAAYIVQNAVLEDNKYVGDIYILDVETKKSRRLTAAGDAKGYVWTKDGELLFSAMRDAKMKKKAEDGEVVSCWYKISPFGGEAELAFTLPVAAMSVKPIDEDRYVVTAKHDNNRPDFDAMEEGERKKAMAKYKNPAYEVIEEAPFWFNGGGFTAGKRNRLYIYTVFTGELKAVTEPWFDAMGYSLNGTKMLYKGVEWHGVKDQNNYSGIYLYDIETGETKEVLAPGTIRTGALEFWADDQALVSATDGKEFGPSQYMDFYTIDVATGEMKKLADYEASIGGSSVGSDARLGGGNGTKLVDDKYYFVSTVNDGGYLRYVDKAGNVSELLTPDGTCDSFDIAGENVLVCGMYGNKLAELYLNGEQVTCYNDKWIEEHSVSTPEYHSFIASDGVEVHGWCMKPAGYEAGKKYPAILHIHGGPRTVFGDVYHHEMQMWANAGYFVFYCNPRGSDGRGNAFGDINGKYGTVDYDNIMEFTDEMLKKYPDIDAGKVGVTGGSYGGFMTNWIIGHTARFACAASQRSIANWIAFEHTSDIGLSFTRNNQDTITRENVDKLWWHSPLKYADNCVTPTLFIHSDRDYRCWMVEGLSMFTALKMHGCESRLCLFKGETHELSRSGKPQNRIRRMEEILGWMDKYLK